MTPLVLSLLLVAKVPAPTFSPAAGTYTSTQTVTVSSRAAGDTIYCTLDGSTPHRNANLRYSGPLQIASDTTLSCRAFALDGRSPSSITTGFYDINITPPTTGGTLSVSGRFLLDGCGDRIVVRGVENVFGSGLWGGSVTSFVDQIAATGANAWRLLPDQGPGQMTNINSGGLAVIESMIARAATNRMVTYLSVYDNTYNDFVPWNVIQAFWSNAGVKDLMARYAGWVVVDGVQEIDETDCVLWRNEAISRLQWMRGQGYTNPMTAISAFRGRRLDCAVQEGAAIVAGDPLHQMIIGVQMYWGTQFWIDYQGTVVNGVHTASLQSFPIQVGFDYVSDGGGTYVDYQGGMAQAQTDSVNWFWWDYYNPFFLQNSLSVTGYSANSGGNLQQPFGPIVLWTHPASINNSSVRPRPYWAVPALNRVRFHARAGYESQMVGGTIQGSNDSTTNGFVTLATISSVSAGWNELTFSNTTPYRWVKYVGPGTNVGTVAEVEFYNTTTRITGTGFGTTGTTGHTYGFAMDGNITTYYEGISSTSNYVGIDIADGYVVATPSISPAGGQVPQTVTISTTTSGATIRYTTDGSDPETGTVYTGPFSVTSPSTVRAIATRSCMYKSAIQTVVFTLGQPANQASMHVGNSLTDTIEPYLDPLAASGGFNLDFQKCTTPGIGTYIYHDSPNCGSGVSNIQTALANTTYNHVTFQPAANMPCLPVGHAELTLGINGSDSRNIAEAWTAAQTRSPSSQWWVYATWVGPASTVWANCLTGGWNRDTEFGSHDHTPTYPIWQPNAAVDAATWSAATMTQELYAERVRDWLAGQYPTRVIPYVVPAGRALVNLRNAWVAGQIPGVTATETQFFVRVFGDTTEDDHLTEDGRYFVSLVFYAVMFRSDPRLLPDTGLGAGVTWTSAQAAAIQDIVYSTVTGYAKSGWAR